MGYLMGSLIVSQVLGPPLAAGLMALDGHGGLKGWQWLFLIEGKQVCTAAHLQQTKASFLYMHCSRLLLQLCLDLGWGMHCEIILVCCLQALFCAQVLVTNTSG